MTLYTTNLFDFARLPVSNLSSDKAWTHMVTMVLHLSHAEGCYGVTFNDVTKDAAFYTTTSRFVAWFGPFSQECQRLWLSKDDLRDSSSWSSPPLLLLRDIHVKLLTQYDCKEVCAPSARGCSPLTSAVNRLFEASFVRDERSASNADVAASVTLNS